MKKSVTLLILLLAYSTCDLLVDTTQYESSESLNSEIFLSFSAARDSLLANGADTTLITVVIPDKATSITSLDFKTNIGSFEDDEKEASVTVVKRFIEGEVKRVGQIILTTTTSPQSELLTVRSNEWSDTLRVTSRRVFPKSISLSASSKQVRPFYDDPITVTAALRNGGLVSSGHQVKFTVEDTTGQERIELNGISLLSSTESSLGTDGNAVVSYTAGETSYNGILHVIASTMTEQSASIADTLTIIVTSNTSTQN